MYSRNAFKLFNSLLKQTSFLKKKGLNSFQIAPSMTTTFNNDHKNLDSLGMLSNLIYIVKDLSITNDSIIKNEIKKTTIHCIQRSLDLAQACLSEHKYSLAGEQASKIVKDLEKTYGKITSSSSEDIKHLAFEAYKLQGKAYKNGTLDQAEIALAALKIASDLEPDNVEAREDYEGLSYGMGIVPEGQQLVEYSDSFINKMRK